MKTLLFSALLILPMVAAHAEPSKSCANLAAVAALPAKAFFADGNTYAIRVSDLQVTAPLRSVPGLATLATDGDVLKLTIADQAKFEAELRVCARAEMLTAFGAASCELGKTEALLEPLHVSHSRALAEAEALKTARTAVDNAQPSAKVLGDDASKLNERMSVHLTQVWNALIGTGLEFKKQSVLDDNVTPLKDALDHILAHYGAKTNCGK